MEWDYVVDALDDELIIRKLNALKYQKMIKKPLTFAARNELEKEITEYLLLFRLLKHHLSLKHFVEQFANNYGEHHIYKLEGLYVRRKYWINDAVELEGGKAEFKFLILGFTWQLCIA